MTRYPDKASQDVAELHALLDQIHLAHVGLVADGFPLVIPTGIARDGDRVLVHGSTGSRWMRQLAEVRPVSTVLGRPRTAPDLRHGIDVPPSVRTLIANRFPE